MYRIITVIFFTYILHGCMSQAEIEKAVGAMYNVPSSGISQFDSTKNIRMSKMVCSNIIAFELYQDTPKHKDGVVLLLAGTKTITNIGTGKSLHLKIDGKMYSLKSDDVLTNHDTNHYPYGITESFSHKTFLIPESLVRKIASSSEFLARIHQLDKTYVEGKCSPITLKEYKELYGNNEYASDVTQEGVNSANKVAAIHGFSEFVRMMDATKW